MTDSTIEAPATPRLKQQYKDVIVPELEKEFKYSNPMQVARVQKVVVSMGVGAAARDSKLIEGAVKDLTLITGQKPKITKAKKSVSSTCAKARPSAPMSPCVASACGSSWIAC